MIIKKLLFVLSIVFLFFSCSNEDVGNKNQPEKIYKITYFGDGYTSGELPVDNNLYAEGDKIRLQRGTFQKEGFNFAGLRIYYAVSISNSLVGDRPPNDDGYCDVNRDYITRTDVIVGNHDIEVYPIWY
jgi:hypothetical protein